GRSADIGAGFSFDADPEFAQRMGELHPAAPDPGMLQLLDAQFVVIGDVRAGFVDVLVVNQNPPGHDQRLRLRPRLTKSALDKGDVQPLLLHSLTTVNPSWRK